MRYFYAKVGQGNSLASEYLQGATPIGVAALPIFFNGVPGNKEDFLKHGQAKEQGRNFFWCGDNPSQAKIVVINRGNLYVVLPRGGVEFWRCEEDTDQLKKNEYIKLLPIEVVVEKPLSDVPAILSSMTANAYYYTGTFREISDQGNVRALQSILGDSMSTFDFADPKDLLLCLSSIGLETLVAKIFEEAGCFVPAYRGGAIKGIDIFARNVQPTDISIGHIEIAADSEISIQVKRSSHMKKPPSGCDYLISLDNDASWILDIVVGMNETKSWLKRSLSWVPNSVLVEYGLA